MQHSAGHPRPPRAGTSGGTDGTDLALPTPSPSPNVVALGEGEGVGGGVPAWGEGRWERAPAHAGVIESTTIERSRISCPPTALTARDGVLATAPPRHRRCESRHICLEPALLPGSQKWHLQRSLRSRICDSALSTQSPLAGGGHCLSKQGEDCLSPDISRISSSPHTTQQDSDCLHVDMFTC